MAPPSQAGRFKPRRAPKKIRPGAASAKDGKPTPVVVGSSSTSQAPASAGTSASSAGRGTGGRRGRGETGRGGRGRGRGRGRIPVQQGQAFFTGSQAAPAKGASSARSGSSGGGGGGGLSKTAAAVARKMQASGAVNTNQPPSAADNVAPTEEIVGMMEEAVGGVAPDAVKSKTATIGGSTMKETENLGGGSKTLEDESGYTYDSDSSRESRRSFGRGLMPDQEPLRLPFPGLSAPVSIGSPALEEDSNHVPPITTSSHQQTVVSRDPRRPSPFVTNQDPQVYEREKESWLLVQLPTRLPPMKSSLQAEKQEGDADLQADEQLQSDKIDVADVATKPVRLDHFDNSLAKTKPGRLGVIRVHKSGKTVLVLKAEDGSETTLQVSEGLACSFQQKAALIDADKSTFVSLGDVGRTLVMTPNLGA
mmetsp:Transcript_13964/g.38604  ORF Transcript_13964/g.38604 Transcript_13964/m.38604 type:complete len:422 (-) Transcript_13964:62-1327(-)